MTINCNQEWKKYHSQQRHKLFWNKFNEYSEINLNNIHFKKTETSYERYRIRSKQMFRSVFWIGQK